MTLAIIIPVFNEEKTIAKVLKAIPKKIAGIVKKMIFVVDDGSIDATAKIAKRAGVEVLPHLINRGVGAATITGFEAAKIIGADVILTIDGDGQHDPSEISKIVDLILKKNYDVVIGSRTLNHYEMPILKSIGNFLLNWITFVFYGLWVSDSQSGFKGFSKNAVAKFRLNSQGYEICSEIIGEIKRLKLRYTELPIQTIYTPYSKKRGQYPLNAINIIIKLIVKAVLK